MILCNREIHKALDDGRLVIEPEPLPRLPTRGQECPYNTHTVDLPLGTPLTIPTQGPYQFDLMSPGLPDFVSRNADHIDLEERGSFALPPHTFALGITLETVALPIQRKIDRSLAARIEGKSSRARCGLLVHFTAPTVHPGWEGQLALEMINLGPVPFVLTHRMLIAQLILEEVRGIPFANPSQFQRQNKPSGRR
jgi:dCTP deaminase